MESTLTGHESIVTSVSFPPDGKFIASGSYDETMKIWDAKSGKLASTMTGHSASVTQLEFRDVTTIVSASSDGTTCFWDVESGAEKGQDAQGMHGEVLPGERFAFSKPNSSEQVEGSFIVTAQGTLVLVYDGAPQRGVPGCQWVIQL